jgi:aryl-phospho-beta-D-glucosidase BglC (GH1 family)
MSVATPLSTSGRSIVDAHGRQVRLAGANWLGAHEDHGVAPGLDRVHRDALARTIAGLGFNSIRLPFSVWMTEQTAPVPEQYLRANPDLYGATPLEVFDACVAALTGAGLIVIPNCHLLSGGWCCSADDRNGLWYNDNWPAAKFTAAWTKIVTRYADNRLVAAVDLYNEPRRTTVGGRTLTPSWGDGNPATDVAALYTAMGNLLHGIDPDLLIICEGVSYAADLTGVAEHPVQLDQPGKIVYSLHDYPWFHDDWQSPRRFARELNKSAGFILDRDIAPLWLGEFSTSFAADGLGFASGAGARWWNNMKAWLAGNDVGWCWWGLNGSHAQGTTPVTNQRKFSWGDRAPDGLLAPDWAGPAHPDFLGVLQELIPPPAGPGPR